MRPPVPIVFAGLTACSGTGELVLPLSTAMGGADGGSVRVGEPCTPDLENSPSFSSFGLNETWVESSTGAPSGAPVCIAYHFQGRISCPYGQVGGKGGNPQCATPDGELVTGPADDSSAAPVLPQCLDRRADAVVVWSCRCANARGKTDDGATYCPCPSHLTCVPTVDEVGSAEDSDRGGSYCLPLTATFNARTACAAQCDPTAHPCG